MEDPLDLELDVNEVAVDISRDNVVESLHRFLTSIGESHLVGLFWIGTVEYHRSF